MTLPLLGLPFSKFRPALFICSVCPNCLVMAVAELCVMSALDTDHSFVKEETGVPSLPTWHLLFTASQLWELVGILVQDNSVLSHLPVFSGVPGRKPLSQARGIRVCVGLWMLRPLSPSWLRLGKVFRVLKPLVGSICPDASDRMAQGPKQYDRQCSGITPLPPAFPQLRPVTFCFKSSLCCVAVITTQLIKLFGFCILVSAAGLKMALTSRA